MQPLKLEKSNNRAVSGQKDIHDLKQRTVWSHVMITMILIHYPAPCQLSDDSKSSDSCCIKLRPFYVVLRFIGSNINHGIHTNWRDKQLSLHLFYTQPMFSLYDKK